MVSFDVKSLFTRVPVQEALHVIEERLAEDETLDERTQTSPTTIRRLTELCMSSTYFEFEENLYEQVDGAPIGSPLSPVLADLYMESFETMAIVEKADQPPSLWLRYVDDTFVIWPHGRDRLNDFLSHLNSLAPSIQFTMEIEEGGKLPFLDVLVQRGCDGLTTSVYRKPTHTDRHLDFRSNHHPRIKAGIVKCLAHRARTVCHPNQVKPELSHLQRVFTRNHYPAHLTRGCLTRKKSNTTIDETSNSDTEVTPKILCLPYVRGLSESIEKSCANLNIKSVFTAKRTLRSLLTRVKSRPDKERAKGVVYKIDCSCGSTYVGETGDGPFQQWHCRSHEQYTPRHQMGQC